MDSTQPYLLTAKQIYLENRVISGGLVIADGKIKEIIDADKLQHIQLPKIVGETEHHVIPGMIDLHIHGTCGADVMDATDESLTTICQGLPQEGTTAFLATTMTDSPKNIEQAISNIAQFQANHNNMGAEILGLHLEGPFIAKEKLGAHQRDKVQTPSLALLKKWHALSQQQIKIVTLAPELANSKECIEFLTQQDIVAAIGHSNANYIQTIDAIDSGCRHATHLFNAMSGLDHRNPGVATAVLQDSRVSAEIITDGIHVHPMMVKLAHHLKTSEKLLLVTDSMRAKCCPHGEYEIGNQMAYHNGRDVRLKDGTLAGSVLKMSDALVNLMQFCQLELAEAIQLTCLNPAKLLGIEHIKGSIAVGKDADLVVLKKDYSPLYTLCKGQIRYQSDSSSI